MHRDCCLLCMIGIYKKRQEGVIIIWKNEVDIMNEVNHSQDML